MEEEAVEETNLGLLPSVGQGKGECDDRVRTADSGTRVLFQVESREVEVAT